ncbi:MlaD family protein [Nocardia sp. alder85J]|uniref:MlaD family protein n=1 Tax=Nocardia sp. alder85J TaxID=2862949 RepID=UPI001CD6374E|nr:MCE family protein [Nocardia sp. alder85J]MCX4096486.1 MCE family protein [Nocardia sp. alder85J]
MIIDPSGRGPTIRQLLLAGVAGLAVFAVILGFLLARYKGWVMHPAVDVTAELTTTGDGLPENADVKFRGVLVGAVKDVSVAAKGELQQVHIEMRPEYVDGVPANVTARVVPSNLFAVTSVELVYNGPDGEHLRAGSQIGEDHSEGTIALQDTLTTVRNILDKIDPIKFGRSLTTLTYALDGNGRPPGSTVQRLDDWLVQARAAVPDEAALFDDLSGSLRALNTSAPDLMDVLAGSVRTAQTIADKRGQLVALITGASGTADSVNALFAANPDVGKQITAGIGDMFGALAADPSAITGTIVNLNRSTRQLQTVFSWGPQHQMVWNAGVTFTPWDPYTVADCPHYGDLAGPSCATAPAVADPGYLPDALKPRALDAAKGLPPVVPIPGLPDILTAGPRPAAPAAGAVAPNPLAGTPLAGLLAGLPGMAPVPAPAPQPPAAAPDPDPAGPPPAAHAGAISYTGDAALERLLGRRPTAVEYLLLRSSLEGGQLRVTEGGTDR